MKAQLLSFQNKNEMQNITRNHRAAAAAVTKPKLISITCVHIHILQRIHTAHIMHVCMYAYATT